MPMIRSLAPQRERHLWVRVLQVLVSHYFVSAVVPFKRRKGTEPKESLGQLDELNVEIGGRCPFYFTPLNNAQP
jgi:hypothetical protein